MKTGWKLFKSRQYRRERLWEIFLKIPEKQAFAEKI